MKILQKSFSTGTGWQTERIDCAEAKGYQLLLVFASTQVLDDEALYPSLQKEFPDADILLSSTAGQITDTEVDDNKISLTAIRFEKTEIKTAVALVDAATGSYEAGQSLAAQLNPDGLRFVLAISDGHAVNGSDFVAGLQAQLAAGVLLTGGLAGDGNRFRRTIVGLNEQPLEGRIVAIGFYGEALTVSSGIAGGWASFGPERLITRSTANVLYELDGKPALDIYKMYLGEYAVDLPQSGLFFPLSIRTNDISHSLVRTIIGVNEETQSLIFAGNVPEGSYARMMRANSEKLIDAAATAAQQAVASLAASPDLVLVISCVGRRLVLDQRVDEELEMVRSILGPGPALAGFYSYGEIAPAPLFAASELHNQTITLTTFAEG